MQQFLRTGFLLIAACATVGVGANAQTVIYATDLSDAQGWTLTSSIPPVVWAVDATPATVVGAASWRSAPYSLNYNDGVNYVTGASANQGTATSPWIDLSMASGNVTFGFWCNWST